MLTCNTRCKKWLLYGFISTFISMTGFAVAAETATNLTQAPKAEADKTLELLDGTDETSTSSAIATPYPISDTTTSANAVKIAAGDTLHISFASTGTDPLPALLPDVKIYTIDAKGYLTLDGIGSFKVAGLSPEETALRLTAEEMLKSVTVTVSILPVEADPSTDLPIFGLSMFQNMTESSTANIPVPGDYIVGPGDQIIVQLYGTESINETLEVSREGSIDFPKIGPVSVAGNSFDELKKILAAKVENQLIGAKLYLTMGELRSVNVFVVGEVENPGNYVVGALSTVVDVVQKSGGLTDIGSMRNIQVKRNGIVVNNVDLYDLLLNGNMSAAFRIQAGDVILVPSLRQQVTVVGDVRRPAIYELKGDQSLAQVIDLAGGLNASAYSGRIMVERYSKNNQRTLIEADLATAAGKSQIVINGDKISVQSLEGDIDGSVKLYGHVMHEGAYAWKPGMTITDVIPSLSVLKKKPDLHYVLVKHQPEGAREASVSLVDLGRALTARKSTADMRLQANDEIYVFGFAQSGQRQYLLSPLIESLKQQASLSQPAKVVSIEGGVFEPGEYPLSEGMKVSDLISAAGKYKESASSYAAEITRITMSENGDRRFEHIPVNLADIGVAGSSNDLELKPYDTLVIKNDPRWTERNVVVLTGEVRYPGTYPIARGEQLSSVIERAGGLTDVAFAKGAVLSRVSVKEAESAEALALADKLEVGMKATILERADENLRPNESLGVATDVINLLRNVEPIGRVVINLPKIIEETENGLVSDADVMLMDGDSIFIPEYRQAVTVIGEVNHPTTLLYENGTDVMDYLEKSGGITKKSKKELAYVIHADGSAAPKKGWWRSQPIEPGDTIVVPMDVEKIRSLKAWSEIASIIGNLVTPTASVVNAAAAWKTAQDGQILIQTTNPTTTTP